MGFSLGYGPTLQWPQLVIDPRPGLRIALKSFGVLFII